DSKYFILCNLWNHWSMDFLFAFWGSCYYCGRFGCVYDSGRRPNSGKFPHFQNSNILTKFSAIDPNDKIPTLTNEQLHYLEEIKTDANNATPPLQRLEHAMHPFVTFVIIPIFAL